LKEGARVAITGKNPATLEAAQKELGGDVLVIASDASQVADQKTVTATLQKAFGALDILFINAGIAELLSLKNGMKRGSTACSLST
jgi:NADP-dependent 3-hydroxy acid dehydrogenase YdfG